MKRIKELREAQNYTQKHLAEMLKTTQQTIARWEAGKAEPNLSALRDLAMIFGTSVDDLLGISILSEKPQTTAIHVFNRGIADGFWGHIGLLLPGHPKSKWFPITLDSYHQVWSHLNNYDKQEWLSITTLNNRELIFDPTKIRRIWLLDDDCDPPDDWPDGGVDDGLPLEFYRGLDQHICDPDAARNTTSESYQKAIQGYIKESGLDENGLLELLHDTTIYLVDGTVTAYHAEPEDLYFLRMMLELGSNESPKLVKIDAIDGIFESYYSVANLVLVEMPLIDVLDAAKVASSETDQEGAALPRSKPARISSRPKSRSCRPLCCRVATSSVSARMEG